MYANWNKMIWYENIYAELKYLFENIYLKIFQLKLYKQFERTYANRKYIWCFPKYILLEKHLLQLHNFMFVEEF